MAILLASVKKQIGLFGGTFDPPHNGHAALVAAAFDVMGFDEIWVIPATPVHRELSGFADGSTRLSWLRDIFSEFERVKVLGWEIGCGKPVATVETLRRFQRCCSGSVPWLMLGADAWEGLEDWREYPAHQALCNVAVFVRAGVEDLSLHQGWHQIDVQGRPACSGAGHYCYIPASLPDISATALRADAAKGESLSGRVPERVRSSIEKHYGRAD